MRPLLCLLMAIPLLSLTACREDFDLEAPYKPGTVVYGVLHTDDTAHYIRIQRMFVAGPGNPSTGAQSLDSNYEPDLDVMMKELDDKGQVVSTTKLVRTDLRTLGLEKYPGYFFNDQNYAYTFRKVLNVAYDYRLIIRHASGVIDSAQTSLVNPAGFYTELDNVLQLYKPDDTGYVRIHAYTANSPKDKGRADLCMGQLTIHYYDIDTRSRDKVKRSFTLTSVLVKEGVSRVSQHFLWQEPQEAFYGYLVSRISPADAYTERQMIGCDVSVVAAGPILERYIVTNQLQQTGITAGQALSAFSNIHSTGLATGVFGSCMQKDEQTPIGLRRDYLQKYPGLAERRIIP